jgi:sulfur-oxidizing protein SoxZ
MANSIKSRLELNGDVVTVKALINHPMSVERKDPKTGETIPAHFIEEFTVTHNGATVMNLACGQAVSMNPFIEFQFRGGKKGEKVKLAWRDNKGQSDSLELAI